MKLPARVKTLLCARLLTNGIGYKEEEEEDLFERMLISYCYVTLSMEAGYLVYIFLLRM